MQINGKTKLAGVIGDPIDHTLSPAMHNAAFEKLRMNWAYVPFLVRKQGLAKAMLGLRALGIEGVNVTIPHKESVMEFIDEIGEDAKKIGAVNTIVNRKGRLIGHNTDITGFMTHLTTEGGVHPSGKKVVMIGAGGVARSIAVGLANAGIKKIAIFDIAKPKARVLSERVKKYFDCGVFYASAHETKTLFWNIQEADILINATPVGMKKDDPLPVPVRSLHNRLFIYDVVYRDTALIKHAKKHKIRCLNGLGMLMYQAAQSFEIWTGKKAPVEHMKNALGKASKK